MKKGRPDSTMRSREGARNKNYRFFLLAGVFLSLCIAFTVFFVINQLRGTFFLSNPREQPLGNGPDVALLFVGHPPHKGVPDLHLRVCAVFFHHRAHRRHGNAIGHIRDCYREEDGLWVLNPGSCGYYGGSAGLMEIRDQKIVNCRILTDEDIALMPL